MSNFCDRVSLLLISSGAFSLSYIVQLKNNDMLLLSIVSTVYCLYCMLQCLNFLHSAVQWTFAGAISHEIAVFAEWGQSQIQSLENNLNIHTVQLIEEQDTP